METFILTWNPENWHWHDLAGAAEQTAHGNPYRCPWSTGNTKRIQAEDRVFLLKQGQPPRGIIAAGWVVSDGYSAPHWDPERAARGEEAWRVDVDFERILDPQLFQPLSTKTFNDALGEVYWAMPASGFQLPDDAADQLEKMWDSHLRASEEEPQPKQATDKTPRNPPWQRDELILALDLYFRFPPNGISQDHPEVIQLSELLNALPIHSARPDAERFRNANGVYMKLCNFLRFDPSYTGSGLSRGNRLEEEVWRDFSENRAELSRIASAIRSGQNIADELRSVEDATEEEEYFREGRILFRLHRSRERNRQLVKRAKLRAKQQHGKLACAACTFDFSAFYGPLGEDFIECHHTRPLSELLEERPTRIDEIALVCSNCHRMLHRRRPWLGIHELSAIIVQGR
jgi:5-methylcytosine-specific restriction protein A